MATSTYNILEYRCVVYPERTDLYVLIDHPTDFMPIGGWRKKSIPPDVPSLDALTQALVSQDILSWDMEAPDAGTEWLQLDNRALREQINELCMDIAKHLHFPSGEMDELSEAALRIGMIMGVLSKHAEGDPERVGELYQKLLMFMPRAQLAAHLAKYPLPEGAA